MKIVSNTKDYYDHVANILGVDETLRYERLPFVTERMPDGSAFYPEFAEFTIPRHVEDDYQAAYPTTPFFRRVNRTDWHDRRTSNALIGCMVFPSTCASPCSLLFPCNPDTSTVEPVRSKS